MLLKRIRLYSLLIGLIFVVLVAVAGIRARAEESVASVCQALYANGEMMISTHLAEATGGQAAFLHDFTANKTLYGKNSDEPLPLASLTKIMTTRVALQELPEYARLTVTQADIDPLGSVGFETGETYARNSVIAAALIASSNDAAVLLARSVSGNENAYAVKMNSEAKSLGLDTLRFSSASGLDIENGPATAFGSARDILRLFYRTYQTAPNIMSASIQENATITSEEGKQILLENTNTMLDDMPLLIASKTGYTLRADGNLAVLWKESDGTIYGASVLGSTQHGRFVDIRKLYETAHIFTLFERDLSNVCA